ncbi:MAG: GAF domain-containing protein [Candidatus Bathyarchaeota archaeon]|nr:GAF domain-containing protein [Candidatus Bathyarchaeota archaeon]
MALEDKKNPPEASPIPPSSMEIIRVLHIDDDESVQMFLKVFVESDPNIKVTQVQDANEAIQLIQTGAYDCFVSDYDMPGMDGITLAGKIREISNVPIIIYTGRGSEEVAERAFAAGIDDYIRKENAPAHYQLVSKRIRQAVERRRVNESYKNLFDNASDAIYIHTLDGKILDVNEVLCTRLGYSKEYLVGKSLRPFVSPQNINFETNLKRVINQKRVVFESTHITKDGLSIPVEVSTRVIKYMGVDAILSFSRDISDRKRLEAQMKERLEALQSHALKLSKCEDVNAVAKTTYQILHEVMGYSFFGLGIVVNDVLRFIPDTIVDDDWALEYPLDGPGICGKVAKKGSPINIPDVRLNPDYFHPKSGYKYLSELALPIKIGGKVVAVLNVEDEQLNRFTPDDVMLLEIFSEHVATSLHRIELIKTTRKHLARLENINRHAEHLTTLNTFEEVAQYSFDVIDELLGFADGCIGVVEGDVLKYKYARNSMIHLAPDLPLNGRGITVRAVRTGESQLVPDTRLDPDFVKDVDPAEYLCELDVPVKVNGRVVAVINLEDKQPGFFGEADREIVEVLAENIGSAFSRIEHLKVISEAEERFRYLLDSAPEGVTVNVLGTLVYVNKHFADMLGYTVDELLKINVLDRTKEEYRETVRDRTRRRALGEDVSSQYEVELIRKDGTFIPVEYSISRINFNGEIASLTFIKDIAHKKEKQVLQNRIISLHRHAHELNELQSIEAVANTTLEILHTHLNCNLLSIRSVDGENLDLIAKWGAKPIGKPIPIKGRGVIARAARIKETILLLDTRIDPDYVKGNNKALSELVAPILCKGELLGVLNAESLEQNAFNENDLILMETLADEVGSAIKRIQSLELEKAYNNKLEALHHHSTRLSSAMTLDEVSSITLDAMNQGLGFSRGALLFVKGNQLVDYRLEGLSEDCPYSLSLDGKGLTVRAAVTGETVMVPDVEMDPDYIDVGLGIRSELAVPVKIENEVVAVLNLESVTLATYRDWDKRMLEILAEHVASSIKKIRYLEEQAQYEKVLEALQANAIKLNQSRTIDEALDTTCEILKSDFGYDWVGIGRVGEEAIHYVRVIGSSLTGNTSISLDQRSITVRAVKTGVAQLVPDTSKDVDYIIVNPGDATASSELVIPIHVNDRIDFVINIESMKLNAFSDQNQYLLELLSGHLGSAVQLIRKREKLNSLHLHASRLESVDNIEDIAKLTLSTLNDVLDFKISSFHVVTGKALEMIQNTGFEAERGFTQALDGPGLIPYATRKGRSVYVPDVTTDVQYVRGPLNLGDDRSSEFVVPILIDGVSVAAINLEDKRVNGFSDEDRELVEFLSNHVASAIQRIEHYGKIKASEERYRGLLDSSFDGTIMVSGTKIINANQRVSKLLGYDNPSGLIGLDASAILPEYKYEYMKQIALRSQKWRPLQSRNELKLVRKDGKIVDVEAAVTLTKHDGKPAVLAIVRDVSESKRFERQMVALRDHAYILTEASSIEDVCQLTLDAVESVIGFQLGSFLIVEGNDLVSIGNRGSPTLGIPISIDGVGITAKAARNGAAVLVMDVRDDPDFLQGITDSLSELAVPVIFEGKTVAVLNFESLELGAFTEVDQRLLENFAVHISSAIFRIKQNKIAKESEEKYRKVLESSLDCMLLMSGTKIIYTNEVGAKLVGYDSVSELIGRDFLDMLPDDEKEKIRQRTLSRQRGESQPNTYELKLKRKDGTLVEVEVAVSLTEYEGKPAILSFARDISERKHYQTKLLQLHGSAKRLAGASTRDEVWDTAIETVSQILGFDFAGIGVLEGNTIMYVRNIGDIVPENWRIDLSKPSITSRTIETGIPQLVRDTGLDPDYLFAPGTVKRGSELASPIIVDGQPVGLLNIESVKTSAFSEADMSLVQILVGQVASAIDRIIHGEEERNRRETRQRELIEGMERMSSMVRHDLRGPLQTIQSASYMLRRKPERAEELTQKIDDSVVYAVRILEDLKTITRPGELNLVSTNLGDLVEKSLDGASIPETVSIEKKLVPLSLEVDQYQIRRVIDNLIKNACEAMPDGGTLTLRLEAEDGMAKLSVKDSGRGIPEDAAHNLFTPFFTTKPKGTGLGLVICKQNVEAHGGKIIVESRVNEGTTFTVALPLMSNSKTYEKKSVRKPYEESVYLSKKDSQTNERVRKNQ